MPEAEPETKPNAVPPPMLRLILEIEGEQVQVLTPDGRRLVRAWLSELSEAIGELLPSLAKEQASHVHSPIPEAKPGDD